MLDPIGSGLLCCLIEHTESCYLIESESVRALYAFRECETRGAPSSTMKLESVPLLDLRSDFRNSCCRAAFGAIYALAAAIITTDSS
jgi:hypothetical protein